MNNNLKLILSIIALIVLVTLFEKYGVIGFIIFLLVIIIHKVYTKRLEIMHGIRTIELMIFKKPLDKELWDKDELKKLKIKFVWRKKNGQDKV